MVFFCPKLNFLYCYFSSILVAGNLIGIHKMGDLKNTDFCLMLKNHDAIQSDLLINFDEKIRKLGKELKIYDSQNPDKPLAFFLTYYLVITCEGLNITTSLTKELSGVIPCDIDTYWGQAQYFAHDVVGEIQAGIFSLFLGVQAEIWQELYAQIKPKMGSITHKRTSNELWGIVSLYTISTMSQLDFIAGFEFWYEKIFSIIVQKGIYLPKEELVAQILNVEKCNQQLAKNPFWVSLRDIFVCSIKICKRQRKL